MSLRPKLLRVARGAARAARTVGRGIKTAALAVKDHPSHVLAVSWIAGMATFSVITVQRARAVAAADVAEVASAPRHGSADDGPGETVAMLDVDQMEKLRVARMHANGLSAQGDTDEPTQQMINDARAELAKGVEVDGEVAGTAGKIRIVSKGGLAGWIKRNKGKKADPETLAWLRGEEAREGGPAYAGWVDRGDGSILNYALDKKHGGNGLGSAHTFGGDGGDANGGSGSDGSASAPAADSASILTAGSASAPTAGSASAPVAGPGSATAPARGPDLRVLGGAAVAALTRAADAHDPSEAERAALAAALQHELGADAPAIVVRDHHLVALLLADRMFDHAELNGQGKAIVRALAKRLVAMPDHAFVISADADGAMETAGYLMISGVDADHMAIRTKDVDRAINLVEVEIIPLPGGGFVRSAP